MAIGQSPQGKKSVYKLTDYLQSKQQPQAETQQKTVQQPNEWLQPITQPQPQVEVQQPIQQQQTQQPTQQQQTQQAQEWFQPIEQPQQPTQQQQSQQAQEWLQPIPVMGDLTGETTPVDAPSTETPGEQQDPSLELENQGHLTPGGQMVSEFWQSQFSKGEFSDVESRRKQLDTEGDQFEYEVMKRARDTAAQQGLVPGTAGYNELMQQAMGQASQNRLGQEQGINQMQRDYRDLATGELTAEEQRAREFAALERGFEFSRADIDYLREQSESIRDEQSATAFLDGIKDPRARNHLARILLEGGPEALKAEASNVIGESGTIEEDFRSESPSSAEMRGIEEDVAAMELSPDGDAWKEGELENYTNQMKDAHLRQKYGLTTEELKGTENEVDLAVKLKQFEKGEIEISDFTTTDWETMDNDQLESISVPFNSSMTYLRQGDFLNSGLTADLITSSTNSEEDIDSNKGVGTGNGSIVMYNGEPYRIVQFHTKKFSNKTGKNERRGNVYAVPLRGENAGVAVQISSTGKTTI